MAERLRRISDRISDRISYVPLFGILVAVLLAVATSWIDTSFRGTIDGIPILLKTTVDSARAILTTAATATITVAGIVISITVVAVQLASSQFSPRVVPTVFGTRFQQTVIGIVIGSFTYTLLVLSRIRIDPGPEVVVGAYRTFAVTLALVLAIVSVLAIVAFIDRSVQVMQVGEIIRRTTDETIARIQTVLPERGTPPQADDDAVMPEGSSTALRSRDDGWVVGIDIAAVLDALPARSIARLDTTVGGFVAVGSPLVTVWTSDEESDIDESGLVAAFGVSYRRKARADATFGVRQLVDVALRALSPGVNDPTTANEVALNLTAILREVLVRESAPRIIYGDDGRRLFRPQEWSRTDWVRHAFGEIRVASTTQPAVAMTLIGAFGALRLHLEDQGLPERVEPLRTEAELVLQGIENGGDLLAADIEPVRALARHLGLVG
ncbi:MAG: DUF2254 domain-containing protein [Acidimicrobiia bacterium]